MKHLFLALCLLAISASNSIAQTVAKADANNSKVLVQQTTIHTEAEAIGTATLTDYSFQALDGKTYPVYVTAKGRKVIIRTAKSGNHYKVYIDEQ